MEKSEKQGNIYLTPEIISVIEKIGSTYARYQDQAFKAADKLNENIDEYFKAHKLWENQSAIKKVIYSLPSIYPRHDLYKALDVIKKKGKVSEVVEEENILSPELLEEIKIMGRIFTKNNTRAVRAQERLRNRINKYMTEHGLWENQDAILEVIELLPGGYLRFNFYETYYELENTKRAEIKEEN